MEGKSVAEASAAAREARAKEKSQNRSVKFTVDGKAFIVDKITGSVTPDAGHTPKPVEHVASFVAALRVRGAIALLLSLV
jgi:hypothetical protein